MVKTGTDVLVLTRAIENMTMWHVDIHAEINYLMPCFIELITRQIDRYVARLSIIFVICLGQPRSMIGEMIRNTQIYKSFACT